MIATKEELDELFKYVDQMNISLLEAPVDFSGGNTNEGAAVREERAWEREWKDAYKKIGSLRTKLYGNDTDKKDRLRSISRRGSTRHKGPK